MRAVVYRGQGTVETATVPLPLLAEPGDALVRVERAAVCGTDLHLLAHDEHVAPGTVLGHEFVGTVLEVGAAVTGLVPGDRVAGSDFTACGRCWWCRRGDHWECPHRRFFGTGTAFGPALPGAQAEVVRVPFADTTLAAVPPGVSDEAAVLIGDVLATGYAAVRRADLRPGDTIVVIGGGPVGQLTSLCAQACGAGPVVVVEPVAERRGLAAEAGALATTPEQARDLVLSLTGDRGADAAVDALGAPLGLDTAVALVRGRGTVVSAGVPSQRSWSMPVARMFAAEQSLRFVIGDAMRDRDAITALVASGVVDPTVVLSQRIGLDHASDGYAAMAERRTLKVLLTL